MSAGLSMRARLWRRPIRWLLAPAFRAGRSVELRRRALLQVGALSRLPLSLHARVSQDTLRGVPVEWVTHSGDDTQRVILYFHGGAYIVGAARLYRDVNARLATWGQARVAAVDYRLAPEHPFPAAPDDALNAYRGLLELGINADDIVLAGDSAGGGLALACALQIRDGCLPAPSGLVLFSPWTDLTLGGASIEAQAAQDIMLEAEALREAAADYLAGHDPRTPLASPLHANLGGLPPMLIQVTDTEILYDDARQLAARVEAAGGVATLDVSPGLWHVWQALAGKVPEADAALRRAAEFVLRCTAVAVEPRRT
ncbi:alpha/beta hydrolase [Solimonas marina]|uniref:Alpha/beta hydrolase n=1 Tax=Solimonas marina TaxID=2714601 RepID=A0A970B9U7_9GAMM|nr:alpha/beta hydrolase [Solimonas marina]NKF22716.1 alpha/beta hydrolase [Solimonas marina]